MNLSIILASVLFFASQATALEVPSNFSSVLAAHAVFGAFTFCLFYPAGAILVRFHKNKTTVYTHAGWMIFCYVCSIIILGLGIWLAMKVGKMRTAHAIIGIIVIIALMLQPLTGYLHHALLKTRGDNNAATTPHVWWGRMLITLGIINGGLGLQLCINFQPHTREYQAVYGALAGIIWLVWMAVIVMAYRRAQRQQSNLPKCQTPFETPTKSRSDEKIDLQVSEQSNVQGTNLV